MPCLDVSCPLFERCPWCYLCTARALPCAVCKRLCATTALSYAALRCLCTALRCPTLAYALPCTRSCIALCMLVHYLYLIVGNRHVVEPMPLFPLHVFAWLCPQGLGGVRPWHGHCPPFSLKTCSPLKEHFRPFSEFLEETSEWLRRYNRIFT